MAPKPNPLSAQGQEQDDDRDKEDGKLEDEASPGWTPARSMASKGFANPNTGTSKRERVSSPSVPWLFKTWDESEISRTTSSEL